MNREIKFRAWDGLKKHMVEVVCLNMGTWLDVILKYPDRKETYNQVKEVVKLMQYTGLKDSKRTKEFPEGQEIYEGDIVEYDGYQKAKVIFKGGSFLGYDGSASSSDEAYLVLEPEENPIDGTYFEIEVIGNIYQNPELLK